MVMVGKILYLEIRYTLSNTSVGTVTSFKLYYSDLPLVQQDPALPAPRVTAVTIEPEAPVVVDTTGAGDDLLTGLFTIPTFSNFVRTTSGLEIKFKNLRPIYYVEQINVFIDDSDGTFQKKEFRWSFNNSYWASWEPLAPANISGIKIYPNKYLYLEIRYVQASEDSGTATSFSIQYKELSVDQYPVTASQADAAAVATDQGTACDVREVTRTNVYDIYDANLLEGKDGDYYLWRANHKGTQGIPTIQGLQEYLNIIGAAISALDPCTAVAAANNVSGSGEGVYDHYDSSLRTLYFRRIDAVNELSVTETDGVITITPDLSAYATLAYVNDKVSSIDASIIQIDSFILSLDASIDDLYTYFSFAAYTDILNCGENWSIVNDDDADGGDGWHVLNPVVLTGGSFWDI
jgi:hypothetical protein